MARTDWKAKVKELVGQVGKPEAKRMLVLAGVAPSTADKLTGGPRRYKSEVGLLLGAAIQRALEASKQEAS